MRWGEVSWDELEWELGGGRLSETKFTVDSNTKYGNRFKRNHNMMQYGNF